MAQSTRIQLEALRDSLIRSGGVGGKITAENIREFETAIIDSLLNILDDANLSEGYLSIDADGRVDVTKINSSDSNSSSQLLQGDGSWRNSKSGKYSADGNGVQTVFTVTHGGGFSPTVVVASAGGPDSAKPFYTDNYTPTGFDVVFLTAPSAGSNNVIINFYIEG